MSRSKRPSAPKLSSSPPDLFCDRSLGRYKVPTLLRAVYPGTVIAHDDLFPQDTDDEVWLRAAGKHGWIVLMKDERICRRPAEQRAVLQTGVACFVVHPSNGMTGEQIATALVAALPRIVAMAADKRSAGFIKGVSRDGRVRHLFP